MCARSSIALELLILQKLPHSRNAGHQGDFRSTLTWCSEHKIAVGIIAGLSLLALLTCLGTYMAGRPIKYWPFTIVSLVQITISFSVVSRVHTFVAAQGRADISASRRSIDGKLDTERTLHYDKHPLTFKVVSHNIPILELAIIPSALGLGLLSLLGVYNGHHWIMRAC